MQHPAVKTPRMYAYRCVVFYIRWILLSILFITLGENYCENSWIEMKNITRNDDVSCVKLFMHFYINVIIHKQMRLLIIGRITIPIL